MTTSLIHMSVCIGSILLLSDSLTSLFNLLLSDYICQILVVKHLSIVDYYSSNVVSISAQIPSHWYFILGHWYWPMDTLSKDFLYVFVLHILNIRFNTLYLIYHFVRHVMFTLNPSITYMLTNMCLRHMPINFDKNELTIQVTIVRQKDKFL